MDTVHQMNIESDNGHEVLLLCPESSCGRRVVLKRSGGMVVIDRGDFFALHAASSGPISMNTNITQDFPA